MGEIYVLVFLLARYTFTQEFVGIESCETAKEIVLAAKPSSRGSSSLAMCLPKNIKDQGK